MKPPHAHINQVKGDKTEFGKDKKHRKMYRISRKAIQNRPLVNINKELQQRPEFSEVKELRRKLHEVKKRESFFENSKPTTLKLAQRLSENKRPDSHAYNEHILHMAALQRRIASANDVSKCLILNLFSTKTEQKITTIRWHSLVYFSDVRARVPKILRLQDSSAKLIGEPTALETHAWRLSVRLST
jgi:hypothetical protein